MTDISNKELLDLFKDITKRSDEKTKVLIETLEESMKKDIELAVVNAKEETIEMIDEHLPIDHDSDHNTVKMVKGWSKSFFDGLFGSAGKIVFIIFLIGVAAQLTNTNKISISSDLDTVKTD